MRPIKDLFFEEYWNIGYRSYSENDSVVDAKNMKYSFNLLKADNRFWYADPFLFVKDGETFLFVEMFDNEDEVGKIGYSKLVDGRFTKPQICLKESFHLSYPLVFEKNGKIYMLPETHEDNCIQVYEAVNFPVEWKKSYVVVENINAADTVIENGLYITSVVCPENDMSVDLCIFDGNGREMPYSPSYYSAFDKRGAGDCFSHKGMRIRPAQSCENGIYGGKIIFNKINKCDSEGYSEEMFSEITTENISVSELSTINGVHTYARTNSIEIVDIKAKRFNIKRLLWIISRKLK